MPLPPDSLKFEASTGVQVNAAVISDAAVMVGGATLAANPNNRDGFLMRLEDENAQWIRFGGDRNDQFYGLATDGDGAMAAVGLTRSFQTGGGPLVDRQLFAVGPSLTEISTFQHFIDTGVPIQGRVVIETGGQWQVLGRHGASEGTGMLIELVESDGSIIDDALLLEPPGATLMAPTTMVLDGPVTYVAGNYDDGVASTMVAAVGSAGSLMWETHFEGPPTIQIFALELRDGMLFALGRVGSDGFFVDLDSTNGDPGEATRFDQFPVQGVSWADQAQWLSSRQAGADGSLRVARVATDTATIDATEVSLPLFDFPGFLPAPIFGTNESAVAVASFGGAVARIGLNATPTAACEGAAIGTAGVVSTTSTTLVAVQKAVVVSSVTISYAEVDAELGTEPAEPSPACEG